MKCKNTNVPNRLYILMRNDLPSSMTSGRAMAQASHASNAFIHKYGRLKSVNKWQNETKQGFGTAIVLAATLPQMKEICFNLNEPHEFILDPEYGVKIDTELLKLIDPAMIVPSKTIINEDGSVIIFKKEITCAYIFGCKDNLFPILGHLQLHP